MLRLAGYRTVPRHVRISEYLTRNVKKEWMLNRNTVPVMHLTQHHIGLSLSSESIWKTQVTGIYNIHHIYSGELKLWHFWLSSYILYYNYIILYLYKYAHDELPQPKVLFIKYFEDRTIHPRKLACYLHVCLVHHQVKVITMKYKQLCSSVNCRELPHIQMSPEHWLMDKLMRDYIDMNYPDTSFIQDTLT